MRHTGCLHDRTIASSTPATPPRAIPPPAPSPPRAIPHQPRHPPSAPSHHRGITPSASAVGRAVPAVRGGETEPVAEPGGLLAVRHVELAQDVGHVHAR